MENLTEHPSLSEGKWRTLTGAALRILTESRTALTEHGTPADIFLKKEFRRSRFLGSRDRKFISLAVFAFYRWFGWLEKAYPAGTEPETLLAAALAAEGVRHPVWDILQAGRNGAGSVFAPSDPRERFAAFAGIPVDWKDLLPARLLPLLAAGAGAEYLPYLASRPPVWIRIQKDKERVFREFREAGIVWKTDIRLPDACRIDHPESSRLRTLKCLQDGCFEFQDFASQRIGEACLVRPGEHWWDVCAGGGGKSLYLASHGAAVTASDIREEKLEELRRRADRAGFRGIRTMPCGEARKHMYDGVLTDVPCSSSGRWRRNPEMKQTVSSEWIRDLCRTQMEILEEAAEHVKPGGYLVYGTCSVLDCENRENAEEFLKRHREFEPAPFPCGGKEHWMHQTFPADADCDGAFRARFRRKDLRP